MTSETQRLKTILSFSEPNILEIHALVKDHKPESYRLCLNPDGTPNIVCMADKTVLYPASAEEIDALNSRKVAGIARKFEVARAYLLEGHALQTKNSPVQTRAYSELLDVTPMGIEEVKDTDGQPRLRVKPQDPDFLPFVRVYGVGLGTQLLTLLKEKRVNYASVIEPNVDLFFSSLFVIPWKILHKYFSVGGNRLSLIVGDTPENSIKRESIFIQQNFPFLTSNFGLLATINDDAVLERLLSAAKMEDAVSYNSSTAGWYDDQKLGLFHSLCNIKVRRPFFTGEKVKGFLRVFIIGSGPSLDDSISYVHQHSDKAIILACGTALMPLLAAGIIPDFHIVQERMWIKENVVEPKNQHLLKQMRLLKLNVVGTDSDCLYEGAYIFQKFMDPGSALMGAGFRLSRRQSNCHECRRGICARAWRRRSLFIWC